MGELSRDKIILSGMVFYGFHGASKEEKDLGQRFNVDLEVTRDLQSAGIHDDLDITVNYSHLYRTVKDIVEGPALNLLEAAAEQIASRILDRFEVESVTVRIKKPEVPIKSSILDYAAVEIHRHRSIKIIYKFN